MKELQSNKTKKKLITTIRKKGNKKQNMKNKEPLSLQQIGLDDFETLNKAFNQVFKIIKTNNFTIMLVLTEKKIT